MFLLPLVVLLMGLAALMTLAVLLLSIYSLHLFIATLASEVLLDVLSSSMKIETLKILNAFDDSTRQAQLFMEKAVEYIFNATDLTTP